MTNNLASVAALAPSQYAAEQDLKRCWQAANAAGFGPIADLQTLTLKIPDSAYFRWVVVGEDPSTLEGARFTEWRPIEGYIPGPEAFETMDLLQTLVTKSVAR